METMDEGPHGGKIWWSAADTGLQEDGRQATHRGKHKRDNQAIEWLLRLIVGLFMLGAVVKMYGCSRGM